MQSPNLGPEWVIAGADDDARKRSKSHERLLEAARVTWPNVLSYARLADVADYECLATEVWEELLRSVVRTMRRLVTKTVPFVQDGEKAYRFTVRWGVETDTDDAEGRAVATSDARPDPAAIAALLPRFTGEIMQQPPAFSAIKINGERAYDLARDGEKVELKARPVTIHALRLVGATPDEAVLEAECGKGTYVRAIARDLGRALGCHGHVTALRRMRVGPFFEDHSVALEDLLAAPEHAHQDMLSVESGLTELPCILLDRTMAARARRGQSVILRGRDAPAEGAAYAVCSGVVIASGVVERGEFLPNRVFNLPY